MSLSTIEVAALMRGYEDLVSPARRAVGVIDTASMAPALDAVAKAMSKGPELDVSALMQGYNFVAWRALADTPQVLRDFGVLYDALLDDRPDRAEETAVSTRLSEAARLAIAIYAGVLLFSLCAALYLRHPKIAEVLLDAVSPATWAWLLSMHVYRVLPQRAEPEANEN